MTCRNCKFLNVQPDADGKRRVRKNCSYLCLAPIPDMRAILPASVFDHHYREPRAGRVGADDGVNCPSAQPVKQEGKAA